ncbi:MAG: DUF924 domain-containing protein [Chlamydiia bacterium]|nr:DUF924 domain-containing protein [Chlamydiia bacterium]
MLEAGCKCTLEVDEVLDYWFKPWEQSLAAAPEKLRFWFSASVDEDQEIRAKFGEISRMASEGYLDHWAERGPRATLALILLLDQVPRNIHRGTPEAFASDAKAQELVKNALEKGEDRQLNPIERVFFYMPLEHAEDLPLQNLSVKLFESLVQTLPLEQKAQFETFVTYAEKHRAVIEQFGRFPTRNAALGRPSTPAEIAFLTK